MNKKKQKNFIHLHPRRGISPAPRKKVFCFFFSKKKILPACHLPAPFSRFHDDRDTAPHSAAERARIIRDCFDL